MIRKIARPMLASVFIYDGVDTFRNTSEHVSGTETVLTRLRKVLPAQYASFVPKDPETVTQGLAAAKVGAGSLLALGKAPRTSAAVLAATTIPTMVGRDAFWEANDEAAKSQKRSSFLTSTALLGGLFITTQDTAGKPSLLWRTQHAGKVANKKIQKALPTKSESQKMYEEAADRATEFGGKASDWFAENTEKAKAYVEDNKGDWEKAGAGVLAAATTAAATATDKAKSFVDDNKDDWQGAGKDLLDSAKSYADQARKATGDAVKNAENSAWLKAAEKNSKVARKNVVKKAAKARKAADKKLAKIDTKSTKRSIKKATKRADKAQAQADKRLAKAIKKVGKQIN